MTTPSNPPEGGAEGAPPPESPAAPEQPTAPVGAAAPPPPPAPTMPPPGPPGPPWPAGAYPFDPVPRGPRTPWINPARRGHVAGVAIVLALLFGGAGLLVGHAVTDHGGGRHGVVRIGPREGLNDHGFRPGQFPRRPGGQRQLPPNAPAPSATTPVPSPSSTK